MPNTWLPRLVSPAARVEMAHDTTSGSRGSSPWETARAAGPRGRFDYHAPRRVSSADRLQRPYAEFVIDVKAGHTYEGVWVARDDGTGLRQPMLVEKPGR